MMELGIESPSLSLTTLLSLAVITVTAYYGFLAARFVRRVRGIVHVVDQFPGPERHRLWGNVRQLKNNQEEGISWLIEQTNRYKTCFRLWGGPIMCVVICCHPDTMKKVMRSTLPKQLLGLYGLLKPWLGDGLLLSSDEKWFRNRRLLTPAFHFDVLKPYIKIYNESANVFIDKLADASREGGSVEICRPITLLTLNVILRESHPYVTAVIGLTKLLVKRVLNPLVHSNIVYYMTKDGRLTQKYLQAMHGVSADVIAKRRTALRDNPEEGKKRYLDFLDILLLARDDNGQGLTDEEIRDEVDTFLFEGHDTTASALSWILYEMARHPQHQQKCREEIDHIMRERDSDDMEWGDLTDLPFTTQCIKEAMRMHSPVPYIGRQVNQEFELNGHVLPPGTFVDMAIHMCNHNEDVWGSDHMEYKPERFDPDRIDKMDSFAFVPFSAGPRNCIGQNFAMHELKVMTSKVLHRFTLRLDETHKVEHSLDVVMRATGGIKVFLKQRA